MDSWRTALRELGYVDRDNVQLDIRHVAPDQLSDAVQDIIRWNPDVMVCVSSPAVKVAAAATRTIPIVALDLETDPLSSGLAATLAHPGGNLTGVFLDLPEFTGKQLEILREALPGISHVVVLWDRSMDRSPLARIQNAAHALHLKLTVSEVTDDHGFPAIIQDAGSKKAGAIIVMQSPRLIGAREEIVKLASAAHIPVMGMFINFPQAGALLSYGPNVQALCRRPAEYVDRILKGARPGDLPIQRPQVFDFAVNVRAAKIRKVTLPQSVLTRADEVFR